MKSINDCKTQEEKTELVKHAFLVIGCEVNKDYSYIKSKDRVPFIVIDVNSDYFGLRGELIWNNVQSGGKVDFRCLIQEDKDKLAKEKLNNIGLEPLESCKCNSKPILFKIIDKSSIYHNLKGKISLSNVRNGQKWDARSLLRSDWEKYVHSFCEKIDYKVLNMAKTVNSKITVKTKKGNIWRVQLSNLYQGSRCPLDVKASFGERCLNELFKLNNINFEYQKTINYDDGTRQFMDFYLPDYNICLEYNGEQHSKEHGSNFGQDYNERVRLDEKKRLFCIENNIKHKEIPYTFNTINKIHLEVEHILNCKIKKPKEVDVQYSELYIEEELIKMYKELKSIHRVAEKFGISTSPVMNTLKRNCVEVYGNRKEIIQLSLNGNLIKEWSSIVEAEVDLNIHHSAIISCCRGRTKTSVGYKWMYKEDYEKYIDQQNKAV